MIGGPTAIQVSQAAKSSWTPHGGHGAHGGGAFSGKDPSKVDRSAAYAARHIAKNLVAAGVADRMLVQVAYAIGVAEPVSINVNTYGTTHVALSDEQIAEKVAELFDMRPYAIEQRLKLRNPIYRETASYGHVGRIPRTVSKTFSSHYEVLHPRGRTLHLGEARRSRRRQKRFRPLRLGNNLRKRTR